MTLLRMLLWLGCATVLLAQPGEYGGPSILSRGQPASNPAGTANVEFRPYLSVSGIYDGGLTGVTIDPSGKLQNADAEGVEGQAGIYGYHNWKTTVVGLDYRGTYRHYTRNTYFDGTDQMLTLGVSHQVSRHTTFQLREAAGTYTRNYFFPSGAGFFDPLFLDIPDNELFDNRVVFLDTSGDLTYQKSARLSFNVGGDGYLVRRRSSALYGMTGATARGDVSYRLSRHSTLGIAYNYTHFEFTRAFGASDIHGVSVDYVAQLSRNWELSLMAGGSRLENLFTSRVQVDPVIAAITGQTSSVEATYRMQYLPDLGGRLTRKFRRAALNFSYRRGIMPGNGIYLTSMRESVSAGYSCTLRQWNVGFDGSYDRFTALIQTIGKYRSYGAGLGVTRQLRHGLSFVLRGDERQYEVISSNFNRHAPRVTIGFAWSPGDVPLSLW